MVVIFLSFLRRAVWFKKYILQSFQMFVLENLLCNSFPTDKTFKLFFKPTLLEYICLK